MPGAQDETSVKHESNVVGGVERFAAEIVFGEESCAAGTFDVDSEE